MKNLSYQNVIFFVLTGLVFFTIYKIQKYKKNEELFVHSVQASREKNIELNNALNTLKENTYFQFKAGFLNGNFPIEQVVASEALIIRVHNNDCNDCIKGSVSLLEKYHIESKMPIIIFADYPDVKAFKSDFPNIHYPVILQKSLSTDFTGVSKPYIFVYNPKTEFAENFVYPNWQLMDVFETYVKLL